MRLVNAVRERNAEGYPALRVIAVYTAADRHATFVREADEAVLIGPADADTAFAGSPYLDYAELGRALRACRANAVWTLGVRDCSVQRRNQKVIEESASTALDVEQEKRLRAHAADLVRAAGYVNAGTVEFLYEPSQRRSGEWTSMRW